MTDWTKMVSGAELEEAAKERKKDKYTVSVSNNKINEFEAKGYVVAKVGKSRSTMTLDKKYYDVFENELWTILYKMGYTIMNVDNTFELDLNGNTKQIDIVAVDEETILIIECKSSEFMDKNATFKKELESIEGYLPDAIKELRKKYPGRKVKHIFATKNCVIGKADKDRIAKLGSVYFDYDTVLYYRDLTNHLGSAAKYQLLGSLFQKVKIEGLDSRVCALRGSMGGLTYYTFLIEPKKMLKLAYILHRNNANKANAPTYQRIVHKERLKAIREFVDNGGYFPNSLICSIDGNVIFEQGSQKLDGSVSAMGILKLPQTYMSMYVIDGQHRLYGYSDSKYVGHDVIPVVAFVDMDKDEQVKMFMDVNENQKPVNKSLRNTLNADLLWDSKNPKKCREALAIKLAEALGTDRMSPLFGRVLVGEESKTVLRCITTEAIKNAILDSNFISKFDKKGDQKTSGSFDRNNNDETYDAILPFLIEGLECIVNKNKVEWDKGGDGYLSFNNTVYAFIRILSDIVDIEIEGLADDNSFETCKGMIETFADVVSSLDEDSLKELRKYGDGGKKTAWNQLQVKFNQRDNNFINEELKAYIEEHSMKNNDVAEKLLEGLQNKIRKIFKENIDNKKLVTKYPQVWKNMGEYFSQKTAENISRGLDDEEVDRWEGTNFKDYGLIARQTEAEDLINMFSNDNYDPGTKKEICNCLMVFEDSLKKINDKKPVLQKDYDLIKGVYEGLVGNVEE